MVEIFLAGNEPAPPPTGAVGEGRGIAAVVAFYGGVLLLLVFCVVGRSYEFVEGFVEVCKVVVVSVFVGRVVHVVVGGNEVENGYQAHVGVVGRDEPDGKGLADVEVEFVTGLVVYWLFVSIYCLLRTSLCI